MNIRSGLDNLPQISQTPAASTNAAPKTTGNAQHEKLPGDQAQVSVAAAQVAQTAAASEVRLDKVASIQSALEAGTYNVPASAVAQAVISSLLTPGR